MLGVRAIICVESIYKQYTVMYNKFVIIKYVKAFQKIGERGGICKGENFE